MLLVGLGVVRMRIRNLLLYVHIFLNTAARHSEEGAQEYLCKWRGVPYSESTWEEATVISHWYQDKIDNYLERNASDRIPNKNAKVLRHRPRFRFMKEQLDTLNVGGSMKLRDYQVDGVNWLTRSWCK